jgi:hypothetical protein
MIFQNRLDGNAKIAAKMKNSAENFLTTDGHGWKRLGASVGGCGRRIDFSNGTIGIIN